MSDSARHAAYFVKETNFGVTPANPAFQRLRHTSLSLGVQRGSLQSEEMRPDRQVQDFRLGTVAVSGEIGTELSFGSFDDFLEAALCGTWADKATTGASTTISANTTNDEFIKTAPGYFTGLGFVAGMIIISSGFGQAANNGTFLIDTVTEGADSRIKVKNLDGSAYNLTTEAAGASVTIKSKETVLKAGTVRRSFSILRNFTDIAATGEGKPYHLFNGVEINTLAVAINPTAIVTATFGMIGREGVAPSNTAPTGATFLPATTSAPLDAFTGALKDGVTSLGIVTEFSFNLDNGMEVRNVVGSKYSLRPSIGRSNLTGSATVYFEDAAFVSKFLNETETALSVELPDAAGNKYTFTFPRVKFTAGQPDVSGQGSVTMNMPFQALFDTINASNIIVTKLPA